MNFNNYKIVGNITLSDIEEILIEENKDIKKSKEIFKKMEIKTYNLYIMRMSNLDVQTLKLYKKDLIKTFLNNFFN
jgi:CBS domain-containing protein